jgi:DNA replication initiation complex subunit (GINS family)
MNDETALKELLSMSRIYSRRGQTDKADECLILAQQIEKRMSLQKMETVGQSAENSVEQAAEQVVEQAVEQSVDHAIVYSEKWQRSRRYENAL